jgi:hypothetical protein
LGTLIKSDEKAGTKLLSGSQSVHPVPMEANGGNAVKPGQSAAAPKNSENDKAKVVQRPGLSRSQSD